MGKDLFINPIGEESKGTKLIPGLWIRTENSTPPFRYQGEEGNDR